MLTLTQMKRLCALIFATFALATVASMAPASAQPDTRAGDDSAAVTDSDAGIQTLAPTCVHVSLRSDFLTKYEDVLNVCSKAYRVKVIVAWGPDSSCHYLDPGHGFTHTHGIAGSFDRLELC